MSPLGRSGLHPDAPLGYLTAYKPAPGVWMPRWSSGRACRTARLTVLPWPISKIRTTIISTRRRSTCCDAGCLARPGRAAPAGQFRPAPVADFQGNDPGAVAGSTYQDFASDAEQGATMQSRHPGAAGGTRAGRATARPADLFLRPPPGPSNGLVERYQDAGRGGISQQGQCRLRPGSCHAEPGSLPAAGPGPAGRLSDRPPQGSHPPGRHGRPGILRRSAFPVENRL